MALREDLISSAVTFLQDPSVANAPIDKRISFLQSKNLTQPEIDASLARAAGQSAPSQTSYAPPPVPSRPQQSQYGYNQYQNGYWEQPPPELPRRDWRDYFIIATVTAGVSYGLYTLAQRYLVPIIAPPTPPQLEQDKASIDTAFERAFTLIDQLSSDTAALRASETTRQERLDSALSEMEETLRDMKTAGRRREDENRRLAEDVRGLQSVVERSIKGVEEGREAGLKELGAELKSLKTLVTNRLGAAGGSVSAAAAVSGSAGQGQKVNGANMFGVDGTVGVSAGMESLKHGGNEGAVKSASNESQKSATVSRSDVGNVGAGSRSGTAGAYPSYGQYGAKGGIPAWQLAAAKKNDVQPKVENGTEESEQSSASKTM